MCEWWGRNYLPISSLLEAIGRGLTSRAFSSQRANCITSNHMLVNMSMSMTALPISARYKTQLALSVVITSNTGIWSAYRNSHCIILFLHLQELDLICPLMLIIINGNHSSQQMSRHWSHMLQVWVFALVSIRTKIRFSEGKSVLRSLWWFCVS